MKKDIILLIVTILVITQVIYHWHGLHGNYAFQIIGIIYAAGTAIYLIIKRPEEYPQFISSKDTPNWKIA